MCKEKRTSNIQDVNLEISNYTRNADSFTFLFEFLEH